MTDKAKKPVFMDGPEPTWWYCETCDDTGEVATDGTGPAWVSADPCHECQGDPEGYWKKQQEKKNATATDESM